jgi:hypothetical protein
MIDPLKAPPEVIHRLNQLKASCKVIRVNKVEIMSEEKNPVQIVARDADRAWRDKYARKDKRCANSLNQKEKLVRKPVKKDGFL